MHESSELPADFEQAVLDALVEGFVARAGAKERFQALSEYELARRIGIVNYSYVEYDSSPERDALRSALGRLQGRGLVRAASVAGRYETFLPTAEATPQGPEAENGSAEVPSPPPAELYERPAALPTTFEGRLDEIVRLMRSIDERLRRLEKS